MKRTIILTSFIESNFDMKDCIGENNILICTDGGYDIALAQGLKPDYLMGDFDSITTVLPTDIPIIRFNPIKDYTDLQLALDKAIELESDQVEIWGGIGGRLDHTVANIQIIRSYFDKFQSLILRDGANEARILPSGLSHSIPAREGWYLSVFSITDQCDGLTMKGTKYPLENHSLSASFPLGVSNEFISKEATIKYDSGILLLILSKM